jgi:AraC-like DNA-binding protein
MNLEDPARPKAFQLAGNALSGERAWLASKAALAVFDVSSDAIGAFVADLVAHSTDRLLLSRITMSPVRLARSATTMARTRLTHFVVKLVLHGSLEGFADGRFVRAEPGDVIVLDLLRPIAFRSAESGSTELLSLWFSRVRLQPALNSEEAIHGLLLKGDRPAGALAGNCLRALSDHVAGMSAREMDTFGGAVVGLIARAIVPDLKAAKASMATAPVSLNAIRRFVDQNLLSKDLDVELIAANFGLSRASLYRLFAPIGGVAVYMRKQKLDRAFQDVISPEHAQKRIKSIAQLYGFDNFSAFTRLFRMTYGITPLTARRAALEEEGTSDQTTDTSQESIVDWLSRLHP